MIRSILLLSVAAIAAVFFNQSNAFTPNGATYTPMKRMSFVTPQTYAPTAARHRAVIKMAGEGADEAEKLREQAKKLREEAANLSGTTLEETETKEKEKSGDLYIDELPPPKESLSPAMRERLMREASTGLDSDRKQTNVLLYICLAVAVLVILGGQGIFY